MNRLILYIFFFICSVGFSQGKGKEIPLQEFIELTEAKFSVKFSYAVEDVNTLKILLPKEDMSLSETITYLNKRTLLNFEIIDERYITVSALNKRIDACGQILISQDKSPLLGVNIIVENTSTGAVSDAEGYFRLNNIPKNAQLIISYIGFETKIIAAKDLFSPDSNCFELVLEEDTEELNEILITKFLTTGLEKRIDGSTVLNTEVFGILPGLIEPDILQSIQVLPGVESADESIANINVRGGTNDQNLILWDGIKMYHSGHFFGLISAYNPNLTNKVIVSKNGTSSEFSDGVSSTINIFTKDEINQDIKGGAGLNLISGDAFLEIPVSSQLALHISGRRSFTDAFTTPTYDNYFERSFQDSDINTNSESINNSSTDSDFSFYDYTAKVLFDLNENHSFRANVIQIKNNLDYSEQITTEDNSTTSRTSNLQQENLGVGAHWNSKWSKRWSSHFIAYYSNYNVDATDTRIETDQQVTQTNDVLDTGLKLNVNYNLKPHLNLLMGYQLNETGILNETTVSNPAFGRTKKDVLINHSLFTEAEYNKGNTYFRIGVRGNYFQKFEKFLVEPRLNIRQKLSEQFALKLEGEFKNQSATQRIDFQDDFLGVENRRWVLADNNEIPISTSKQGSFGIGYTKNNFNIDVTSFYKEVDGITASNQGFYNNFQFRSATGSYTAKGLEFLANKTALNYSAYLSYTYSTNDYTFEAFTPSSFPNNVDIRHSVNLGFNYDILERLKVAIGGQWRSGRPYTIPVEGNETVQDGNTTFVNYDSPNGENLDPFMRLDASLSYDFKLSSNINASLKAGVLNVTNERNTIIRYYEVDPNDDQNAIEIENRSLGFTPNLSFRVRF